MSNLKQIWSVPFLPLKEEIISKRCRETHCHYCFNELPVDMVPCVSCSASLYCSLDCQHKAGGWNVGFRTKTESSHYVLSGNQEKHVAEVSLASDSCSDEWIAEHKHECGGVNWPSVLPSELVLGGRILFKIIGRSRCSIDDSKLMDLIHNYADMAVDSKLELHIYSIVLLYCLQHSYSSDIHLNGTFISQLVIILSQIRVNSMAVVRIRSADANEQLNLSHASSTSRGAITDCTQQVRVGQAIYSTGSLFNHSCEPNIHAYFLSRTLLIRSTEFVAAGHPLELSYGPQLGQWDCIDRQQFLEGQYSFKCQCTGCSELNLSDLVINSFRCVDPHCFGIVLDSTMTKHFVEKVNCSKCCRSFTLDVDDQDESYRISEIRNVARAVFERTSFSCMEPGYCLNCNSHRDLESARAVVNKAGDNYKRLREALMSRDIISDVAISEALNSLNLLKSALHPYNRVVAEAEDNLAEALSLVGELQPAMNHCKASIEILEKLYGLKHIVIAYELVKLSTIQTSLVDHTAADSINRLVAIFSCYYGSHAEIIFPYLRRLKKEACNI